MISRLVKFLILQTNMISRIKEIIVILLILIISSCSSDCKYTKQGGYLPPNGVVPDEETAIKIAEAIWLPIYGDKIKDEQPYVARLCGDKKTWFVHGSLPKGMTGGTAEMEINKKDGKILTITHGK